MEWILVMLLSCRQDPLVVVTCEGSDWSKARQVGILEVNMVEFAARYE